MSTTLDRIAEIGVVPVIVIDHAGDAPALVDALRAGGVPIAEITFRTDAAVDAIRAATEAHPDVLVGAGSAILPDHVDRAIDAGARFIVSPGFEAGIVDRTLERGVTIMPGCATSSDLMQAAQRSLDCVKFHPAEPMGGLAMVRALAAPFPGMRFVPSGGIDLHNLEDYIADPRVLAVGGSWIAPAATIRERDWSAVTRGAREAVAAVRRARERHA